MFSQHTIVYAAIFILLAVLNLLVDTHIARNLKRIALSRDLPLEHYSFVDGDYPLRFPSSKKHVLLSIEESVRFSMFNPEATDEWLWMGTSGDHNVHFGSNRRFFSTTMTHQQHCMTIILEAMQEEEALEEPYLEHTVHCLSYLRQAALCAADSTLEPPIMLSSNYSFTERIGATHTCFDWPEFYKDMKSNWLTWKTANDQGARQT